MVKDNFLKYHFNNNNWPRAAFFTAGCNEQVFFLNLEKIGINQCCCFWEKHESCSTM